MSALLHVAWFSGLVVPARSTPKAPAAPPIWFEVTAAPAKPAEPQSRLGPAESPPVGRGAVVGAVPARPATAPPVAKVAPRRSKASPLRVERTPVLEAPAVAALAPGRGGASPTEEQAEPPRVSPAKPDGAVGLRSLPVDRAALSPRAVAASVALSQLDAAVCRPSSRSCGDAGVAQDKPTAAERLQASLDHTLDNPAYLEARPPPKLQRRTDGSYFYRGPVIAARIAKDGSVAFGEDIASAQVEPGMEHYDEDRDEFVEGFGVSVGGSFDLMDFIERDILGLPIYTAEKRWFLEQTQALRERLAREYRAEVLAQANRRLRGRLLLLLEDEALTGVQLRAAVFELWDDCADDAIGAEAKAVVEAFVREHLPKGGPLAFGEEELRDLNEGRLSSKLFDPYG